MRFLSEPARRKFGGLLIRTFRPEVSFRRQAAASGLFVVALAISFLIFKRVDYAYCHLLAGMGVTWMIYALIGSPRLGVLFTVVSSSYNEFVVDLAKPDHPTHVDWDQLVAGFVGAAIGYYVLVSLRHRWPGREWKLGI